MLAWRKFIQQCRRWDWRWQWWLAANISWQEAHLQSKRSNCWICQDPRSWKDRSGWCKLHWMAKQDEQTDCGIFILCWDAFCSDGSWSWPSCHSLYAIRYSLRSCRSPMPLQDATVWYADKPMIQKGIKRVRLKMLPSPKLTNIAPENGWLEYYFSFGKPYFQVLC